MTKLLETPIDGYMVTCAYLRGKVSPVDPAQLMLVLDPNRFRMEMCQLVNRMPLVLDVSRRLPCSPVKVAKAGRGQCGGGGIIRLRKAF